METSSEIEEVFIEDVVVKTEYTVQDEHEILETSQQEMPQAAKEPEDGLTNFEMINFEIKEIDPEENQTKEKKHKCDICEKSFTRPSYLRQHTITHTGYKEFHCPQCSTSFTRKETLQKHMVIMHTEVEPVTCTLCQKNFKNSESLKKHVRTHTAERTHECGVCGYKFYNKAHVKRHILEVHEGKTPERPGKSLKQSLICRYCGREFWQNSEYSTHLLQDHGDDNPFECSVCFKKFKEKVYLKRHMACHETDKPFPCPTCGKMFKRKEYVRMHMVKTGHLEEGTTSCFSAVKEENTDQGDQGYQEEPCEENLTKGIKIERE